MPELRAGRARAARGERLSAGSALRPLPARRSAASPRTRDSGLVGRGGGAGRGRFPGCSGAAALRATGRFRPLLPPFLRRPARHPPGSPRAGLAPEERLAGGQQVPRCAAAFTRAGWGAQRVPSFPPLFGWGASGPPSAGAPLSVEEREVRGSPKGLIIPSNAGGGVARLIVPPAPPQSSAPDLWGSSSCSAAADEGPPPRR